MAVICPTVTAYDPHEYREQIERVEPFAKRIHIDLMDGHFAPTKSIDPKHVWWSDSLTADIHMMFKRPELHLPALIKLRPRLIIVHAEAETDFKRIASDLHRAGIKAGIALLQDTAVKEVEPVLKHYDHVLIFSGRLGYHGGKADLKLLDKVRDIQELHPHAEIGWDGGVTDQNAKKLAASGVDVLNVGGFVQKAEDSQAAYDTLHNLINH